MTEPRSDEAIRADLATIVGGVSIRGAFGTTQAGRRLLDDVEPLLARAERAERVLVAALAAKLEADSRATALQGVIDRCVAHIRDGQQLRPDEPDAGLEALVVGWVNYHGDCCNFKARAERAEADRDRLDAALTEIHQRAHLAYQRLGGETLRSITERAWRALAYPDDDAAAVAPAEPQDEVLFRTPDDWSELFGVIVLDPDGWRSDGQSWDQPITREEFNRRGNMSTIGPSR